MQVCWSAALIDGLSFKENVRIIHGRMNLITALDQIQFEDAILIGFSAITVLWVPC